MENLKFYEVEKGDLYFISVKDGGYSKCIRPQDYEDGVSFFPGSVLANCVGFACGAFNENIAYLTGIKEPQYPLFNCNAEDFIERAKKMYPDLIISNDPVPGGMMVWHGKGDLAGHVCYVNDFKDGIAYTAESSYGGSVFYNKERNNGNGRWSMSGSYTYLGCINPSIKMVPGAKRDLSKNQVLVTVDRLRIRLEPNLKGEVYCYANNGDYYNVYQISSADGYLWYKISEDGKWIANVQTKYYEASEEEDLVKKLEIFMTQLKDTVTDLSAKNGELEARNTVLDDENKKYKEAISQIASITQKLIS